MKKLMSILGVLAIGTVGILTQVQLKQNAAIGNDREVIKIESSFERNLQVNELIEHLASVEQMDYEKEKERYIGTRRQGGVVELTISGLEEPKYYEQVEKIERVLELEGLVDLVYDKEQLAREETDLQQLKDWESVGTQKYYDQALVGIRATKVPEHRQQTSSSRTLFVVVPSEKLKDDKYIQLADRLCEEGYYVRDLAMGGMKQMLILENKSKLLGMHTEEVWIDENGERIQQTPVDLRYEILTDEAEVEGIRMIIQSYDTLKLTEEDKQIFINAAYEMGLDDAETRQLIQSIDKTLEHPAKLNKEQIGRWDYKTHYEQEKYGDNYTRQGLEITLYE